MKSNTYRVMPMRCGIYGRDFFLDITNKHAAITNIQVKGSKIPYVTSELKTRRRQRDYLRAKANKTGSSMLRQAYGQVRAKVKQKVYELRKNYYTSKIEQHKYDLKNTWKVLKGAIGKLIKPLKLKRLALRVKNLLIKSKSQN